MTLKVNSQILMLSDLKQPAGQKPRRTRGNPHRQACKCTTANDDSPKRIQQKTARTTAKQAKYQCYEEHWWCVVHSSELNMWSAVTVTSMMPQEKSPPSTRPGAIVIGNAYVPRNSSLLISGDQNADRPESNKKTCIDKKLVQLKT